MRRSAQASSKGIIQAKHALAVTGLTQMELAMRAMVSRTSISKFFNGKPVDVGLFTTICSILGLDWESIAETEIDEKTQKAEVVQDNTFYINPDYLVQEVRKKIKLLIQERCSTMRVLDMTQPIGLNDIYTSVNILEKITGRRRKEISELLKESNSENFERFGLGRIAEKRVPGLEAVEKYPKLMILGKPGAGKTTFLKYLAIQSVEGKFKTEIVPIFITLKDFAEATNKPSLLEYISQQLATCEVTDTQVVEILENNKALVLLDGLDEVREKDSQRVLKEIRDFSDQFRNNHFVMTCRIAAKEYAFEKFFEVEVADFDKQQIVNFANNWFNNKAIKANNFLQCLEENDRIYELATNPLLLTLLCLVFEESGYFPANRSELYKEGIDALLKKWDAKRGIQREQIVYKKLSVQRKEDLLSKIALNNFERSDYLFKQKVAEQQIIEYIRNLPDASTDPEVLQLDTERVLKSIEAQHGLLVERAKGIYSFSHLVFHEYFTAREFITVQQSSEAALKNLLRHITDERWLKVFLLVVGMSPNADHLLLLMKEKIDGILAADEKLQKFLIWVNQKSISVNVTYKLLGVKAFYFALDRKLDFDRTIYRALGLDFDSDPKIDCNLDLDRTLYRILDLNYENYLDYYFDYDYYQILDPELSKILKELTEQPPKEINLTERAKWWKANEESWAKQLSSLMIKYRNIGHDWQFSEQQKELLEQYHDANILLVECLNSDCYVSREVRQYIEDTLLLPICEIEKYSKPNL